MLAVWICLMPHIILAQDFCAWVCIFVNVYFLAALRTQRPRKPLQLTRAGTWQPFGTECWPSRLSPHSRRDPLRPGALSLLLLSSFDSLAKGLLNISDVLMWLFLYKVALNLSFFLFVWSVAMCSECPVAKNINVKPVLGALAFAGPFFPFPENVQLDRGVHTLSSY